MNSFSSFALSEDVVNLSCVENGAEPGLESITIVTQPSGKMRARVKVHRNSPSENYSFFVRRMPPIAHRLSGQVVYRAALARFRLSICANCALTGPKKDSFPASVTFHAGRHAKLYQPETPLEYKDLACRIVNKEK